MNTFLNLCNRNIQNDTNIIKSENYILKHL